MNKIIECVPNISEGRNQTIIDACADAVRKVKGAKLLDVDPGKSTNRTVFTFVGDPESVVEAAFQFTKKAYELIDMTTHHGEHPRMGAVDVCPFVPVANVTIEECVEVSKKYGAQIAENTSILYGGSCKGSNAKELFQNPDVDGGLIGGASLKAEEFLQIVNAF